MTSEAKAARPAAVFLRLQLADALRSRWLVFTCAIYAVMFAVFVVLGLRESSVLGFTGISRVLLSVASGVVVIAPLVALVATSQSIVQPRTTGTFELLLAQPSRRSAWFLGLWGSRMIVLAGPLVFALLLSLLFGALLGELDRGTLPNALRAIAVSVALVTAFVGIGLWLSSLARTPDRAVVYALVAWLLAAALHDFLLIGALLQARVEPAVVFALAALNPVEGARIAVLSGVDPELSVLGPVGFWLANHLGPHLTLAVGVGWPLTLGVLAAVAAARRLGRADLVA